MALLSAPGGAASTVIHRFRFKSAQAMLFMIVSMYCAASLSAQSKNRNDAVAADAANGWLAFEKGELGNAKILLQRAVAQAPQNPDFQAALGIVELQTGDSVDGRIHLSTAVRLSPQNAEYRLRLAQAEQVAGNDLHALELLRLQHVEPGLVDDWHFTKGFSLFRIGRYQDAEGEFELLTKQPLFAAPAHFFLGNIAFSQDRFEEALLHYEIAVEQGNSPSNVAYNAYLYDYGLTLYRLGRFEQAREQFLASAARYGKDPLPWMYIGQCDEELGKYTEAIEMLEKAIALDPKFGPAYYELARLHKKHGDAARAEVLFAAIASMKQEELAAEQQRAQRLQLGAQEHTRVSSR